MEEDVEEEVWKDCLYYPDYIVSNQGNVARKKDGIVLKQYLQKNGYSYVWLERGYGKHTVPVHRLAAIAFHGDDGYAKGLFVDHINTVRSDNRACNLRWVTPKENANNEITKLNRKNRKFMMTKRENAISAAARKHSSYRDSRTSFICGARWADGHPDAVDMPYLQNWYQDSIDETKEPIWTDKHLEELFNDFYLIPKK